MSNLWQKAKTNKFFRLILVGAIIVGILIGRAIYLRSRPPEYKTTQVTRSDIVQTIDASGEVKAQESVDLHFQALGKLAWIGVKEGDSVKKWQAVAGQDRQTLEKQLRQELNDFEKEMRDYGEAIEDNPLVNQSFKRILEQAHYDLSSAVIDVEIKNLAIELATLVSPIEGIVTHIDTPVAGVNLTATDVITIVNPATLYFSIEVDETDVGKIKPEQKATINLDAYPDEEIDSEVKSIAFEASTSEGGGTVFQVKLPLPLLESSGKYRLGMNGESTIVLAEKQGVLVIPVEAVKIKNGSVTVEVLADGKAKIKPITTGIEGDTTVEVVSGLEEGETVITGVKKEE